MSTRIKRKSFVFKLNLVANQRGTTSPALKLRKVESFLLRRLYDIRIELIAREVGVLIADENGLPVQAPLNLEADIGWVGYAKGALRSHVEPPWRKAMKRRRPASRTPSSPQR